jgi:hypothetical protein
MMHFQEVLFIRRESDVAWLSIGKGASMIDQRIAVTDKFATDDVCQFLKFGAHGSVLSTVVSPSIEGESYRNRPQRCNATLLPNAESRLQ